MWQIIPFVMSWFLVRYNQYMMKFALFLYMILQGSILVAATNSDAFVVHAKFDKFTILSPSKINKVMSVIIHNDTLVNYYGKLVSENKSDLRYITIPSQSHKSFDIKNYKGQKYIFFPVSPPFQKVVLDIGRRYYEIPEKK